MTHFLFDIVSAQGSVIERDLEGGEFVDLDAAIRHRKLRLAAMMAEAGGASRG